MTTRSPIRRIAIIGAGPMGLSLAAYLLKSRPVVLVVRNPERIAQLHGEGIRLLTDTGEYAPEQRPLIVGRIADLTQFDDVDLIFIATKTSALPEVCRELQPVLTEHSTIVSYQNGFNTGREILDTLSTREVVRMVLKYGANFDEGGRVIMSFASPPHYIGALRKEQFPLCREIAALLSECGLPCEFIEEIEPVIWEKSLLNAATSPVCALTHTTIAEAMAAPTRNLIGTLLEEGISVARHEGIPLPDDFLESSVEYLTKAGNHYPSMVQDIENHSPTEITQLNQQIIEMGRRAGIPTIAHDSIVALIMTIDLKALYGGQAPRQGQAPRLD